MATHRLWGFISFYDVLNDLFVFLCASLFSMF